MNIFVDYLQNEKNLKFQEITLDSVEAGCILEFLDWLQDTRKSSPSTRNHRLMVLRSFFRYAGTIDCAQIDTHFKLSAVPVQKQPTKIVEYLTDDALKALFAQADLSKSSGYRNMVFLTLMYDCAARCSEILDVKVKDLNFNSEYPTIFLTGKGNKSRLLPVMKKNAQNCKQYLSKFHHESNANPEEYLFYTVSHGIRHRMSPATVASFVKKYGEQATQSCSEVPKRVHPHQIRHTRAIHLYRDGMPMALLSEFLGHASPETTKIYAYSDAEMKREAIQKAEQARGVVSAFDVAWDQDEETLKKLCGLK